MKIVFWSEEAACGTTSNMIATASMIAAKHNCRIAMLSAEKNVHDLVGNFARPDSATVNEECSYYVLEGLDYLLMAGKYGSLTEHHLEEALQPVVDGKLFCLPQGKRMLCDFYPKETRNVLNQVIRLLDESMDFSFIDCGSETGRSYCGQFQPDITGIRSFLFNACRRFGQGGVSDRKLSERCCL